MRRRKKDRHLPPCVHHRHGAFYLVKRGKWEWLGKDLAGALAEYGRRVEAPKGGMAELIDEALAALKPTLAPTTRAQYRVAAQKLKHMLGEFAPNQVRPKDVAQVKRQLAQTPNMANRCLSVLRQVFNYAVEEQRIDSNPAIGIKRHHEARRKRLISLEEYTAIYANAGPRLQVIMDLLFLTGQRVNDVLRIRYADLKPEGIYFEQDKTEARLIVRWTPELHAVVERAKTLHGNVRALTLLHNRRGKPPDYGTVKLQWNKAVKAAEVDDADLRDLRAMAATAAKRQAKDPTSLLGHTSAGMTERYLREKEVPQVDGPSFGQLSPSFGQLLDVGQKKPK
jgi:integrase